MKLKERSKQEILSEVGPETPKKLPLPAELFLSALLGALAADTDLGGRGSPLCVSTAAVLSPANAAASFAGAAAYMLINGRVNSSVTEIISIPAVIISKAAVRGIMRGKRSPAVTGTIAAAAYVICGILAAVPYKITLPLVMALIFRGIICGAAAYLSERTLCAAAEGQLFSLGTRIPLSAVYVIGICMLSGISFGAVDLGRAAGAFVSLAAAYKYGCGAGGAAAVLAAVGTGAAFPAMAGSSPVLACSALAAGAFRRKGRLAAGTVFICLGLAGSLVYGMPADSFRLLADMSAAAVIFCVVPDRIMIKNSLGRFPNEGEGSAALRLCGERLRFASAAAADLREGFSKASEVLEKSEKSRRDTEPMREIAMEQLGGTEKLLENLGAHAELFPFCDEELSESIAGIISACGGRSPKAAALSGRDGRLYIECFYGGMLNIRSSELTEKLSAAADRELAPPEAVSFGGTTRLCFHEPETFRAEIGSAKANGREDTSGDHGAVFRDGCGNLSIILSDGMGSGLRAAAESFLTVSSVSRMIRAGMGAEAAIRLVNLMLLTKSGEECFSTIDIFTVDLFTGRAELIKLGAAQSFIKSCGTVKTVETRTTPVGIVDSVEIDRRRFQLSDGDQVVMMTDGICEECFPKIKELMLSAGVTPQECSDRIVAAAEAENESCPCRRDDKTVFTVRLHKI